MGIPGNDQADEEERQRWMTKYNKTKNAPKRSRKIVQNRNDKDQKRAMEKRKQQH
jgi:hypothetical protein